MRKYGKWVLTLGLLAATPGLTLAAGSTSSTDDTPAADEKKAGKNENQRVAEEIKGALIGKRVQGDIGIEFKNGVAILSGTVGDARMKDRASEAVKKVHGVTKVDNRMTVAEKNRPAMARAPVGSTGGVVSANHTASTGNPSRVQQVNAEFPAGGAPANANQAMAQQIADALTTANLDGYDIGIRFKDGVALLEGSVGTQAEKATATRVVQTIPGVRSVANRLSCMQEPAMPMAGPQGQRMAPGQMPPQGQMPPGYGPMAGQGQAPAGYGPPPGQGQMPPGYGPPPGQGQMPPGYGPPPGQGQMPPGYGPPPGQGQMYPAGYRQGDGPMPGQVPPPGMGAMPMAPGAPMPPTYGNPGMGASQAVYNNPSVPDYAWPSYAQYPNSAAVSYPQQYSASAWPYIGPFYPYPQVPLGWRDATLRWDDGQWNLMFRTRTDKWWWYFNPNNW